MISRKSILAMFACGLLAIGLAACGGDDDGGGSSDLSGTIRLDGSSTVFPFAQAAAELFNEDNPNVKISVGEAGTSGGFEKFCAGEIDIADASRPIEPEEVDACKKDGVSYTEIPVANDGISVTTNPPRDQLPDHGPAEGALEHARRSATTASSVRTRTRGQPLPDADVSLYGPGTDSGTFDYFTDVINGEEGVSRDDYTPSEDDNVLVEGVSGDQDGLGYFGFSYYAQNQDALNLVSVDDGKGCVAPSNETIQSGEYAPLSRPLFMYPSADAIQKPEVKAYMQYVVDNYESIAEQAQIVPMDSAQAAEATLRLREGERLGGSKEGERSTVEGGTRAPGEAAPGTPVLGAARRRWGEEAIRLGLFAAAVISVLTTLGIVASLLSETIKFFEEVGVGAFITDGDWKPLFADPEYGIWPLINGTLLVTAIAILVAIPVGLGSAIYLSEYASPRTRRVIKPVLEVLVGVPTVVLGFFALTFVTPTILHDLLGLDVQVFNALSAGLVMGIMIVPTIASVSEDAMSAVPGPVRATVFASSRKCDH